jgi:hypothetical protein
MQMTWWSWTLLAVVLAGQLVLLLGLCRAAAAGDGNLRRRRRRKSAPRAV